MNVRLLVGDDVVCEGESIPIPRVGDVIVHDNATFPVEAITWDYGNPAVVTATLVIGSQPYTY